MKKLIIRWHDLGNSDNDCYQVYSTEKHDLFKATCNFMNRNAEILNLDFCKDSITHEPVLIVRYRFRKGTLWSMFWKLIKNEK